MKRIVIAVLIFSCSVIALNSASHGQTLKVGMTSKTLFYLPFFAGRRHGF